MKNVLILSGSPRRNGNSDLLCDAFFRGAEDAGNQVEKIFIRDKKIGYCNACYGCRKTGKCVIKDDMAEILEKMLKADVIVMASPVYFYGIDAQIKTVIDRTYACWKDIKDKELYYIVSCAENADACVDMAVENVNGWEICLPNAVRKGVVYGKGVYGSGEIKGKRAMIDAYEMGKNV